MKEAYYQLEFDKVRQIISENCHSESGKRKALHIDILPDREQIRYSLDIISEVQEILKKGYSFDFTKIISLEKILFHFEHRNYSFEEFRSIYYTVNIAIAVNNTVEKEKEHLREYPCFKDICDRLISLPDIAGRYNEIFNPEGDILDSASPELKQIRRRQSSLRKSILNNLEKKLSDRGLENIIQDKIITQREGRYVIPVKEGGTSTVSGIIHGYSGSRATVFVEPSDVVNQNNELHSLKRDEEDEIYRIFCEFTDRIIIYRDDIHQNNKLLTELDFYFGCARQGNIFNSRKPKLSDKHAVKLINARHPLLIHSYKDIRKVIPFDLTLGEGKRILILSGPNTGGKTITLKTVGLLTLMTLCGIPVPADESSEIGFFENIFTDINDDQSIENSLSTFSSHIAKIKTMLRSGNERSLILIDEIGSATDPEQGSALAQAILEKLVSIGVIGVVTTHYTPLKIYAAKSDYCINAAMQFDPEKHQPTYYFEIGLPGNSFALEIATGLGLDKTVIDRAKELTGKKNVELTNLITSISNEKKEIDSLKYDLQLKDRLLSKKIKDYDKIISDISSREKEIRAKTIAEAKDFLTNLQKKLNQELETVVKAEKREKKGKTKEVMTIVAQKSKELAEQEISNQPQTLIPVGKLTPGDAVWVNEFSGTGIVKSIDKDKVTVDINNLFFTTTKERLFIPSDKDAVNARNGTISGRNTRKGYQPEQIQTELKLLGMTYDESLPLMEKFLDNGYNAGLERLRIVHGVGTGALRSKIRNRLKSLDYVADFYSPPQEMGGEGVTVVCFKKQ